MTPAERLIAAADLLDKRAGEAVDLPWQVAEEIDGYRHGRKTVIKAGDKRVVTVDQTRPHWDSKAEANVRYIATMHPEAGKAQAAWLRESAADLIDTPGTWTQHALCARFIGHPDGANRCRHYDPALRLADLILGGAS